MTTMVTLAPAAVNVPGPYASTDPRPASSSNTPGRAVRPLPRKQTSSFITTTSTSSPAASAHGTPTSRSASASHPSSYAQIHRPGSRSATASVAGSSKGTPISSRAQTTSSSLAAAATTTTPPHPAEPELRPSSTAPAPSTSTAPSAATSPTPTAAATATTGIDIHTYNPHDLLRLLATLLTQIATTNDALPPRSASPTAPTPSSTEKDNTKPPIWHTLTSASRISLSTPSTSLSFHARNVPTISLEAYLLRILKYCPTTNEVFLALLVYFDRMSKLVNDATHRSFVIDSFNVHRLVIAGVTVASKFFSDVFYTNSRYAKVGGLPLAELNQLELQFLLLNDFRLTVHPDEMQRYADQLILFSQGGMIPSTAPNTIPNSATGMATEAPRLSKQPEPPQHSAEVYREYAGGPSAMGAFDAFGGKIMPDSHSTPPASANVRVMEVEHGPDRSYDADDGASECGTEMTENTETGTEGGETDDEPTIRPDRSCAGSECGGVEDDA